MGEIGAKIKKCFFFFVCVCLFFCFVFKRQLQKLHLPEVLMWALTFSFFRSFTFRMPLCRDDTLSSQFYPGGKEDVSHQCLSPP